ncbi:Fungal specific transcription factor domain-containing protein [Pleurostoma richardsiae]|uniref:Fungal specific transcription factor domain-containing protein n=1 Tax=Pleurostoma richardsiae TaxID=41990 RepID=A0AA38RE74_9PEZI|nr:Fungal specific transcription factor domain-containing protein [Pleurostoma richardsiae]
MSGSAIPGSPSPYPASDLSRARSATFTGAAPGDRPPSDSGTRKRKRVPVACSACRARKSRCDGLRPKCSSCTAQQIDCIYAHNVNLAAGGNATVPAMFLELVERRLTSVERDVRILKRQSTDPSLASVAVPVGHDDHDDVTPRSNAHASAASEDAFDFGVSPDATDGVGTIEFTDEEDSAYFGASSNIAFTRIIRRAVAALLRDSQPATSSPTLPLRRNHLTVSRPPSPIPRGMAVSWLSDTSPEACRVPPEGEMSRLVRRFFSDTGMLFPYISEASFWRTYASAKESRFRRVRQSWLGLLNMILAMATSTCSDTSIINATDRAAHSEIFFVRARALCLNQMMDGASVEIVQVMLLMTQYLQGTQRSIKTWTIHGLAVKAALQLGLHSEEALTRLDPAERETRIRMWHGCIILDRTLSMTFGRPPAIPEAYIKVPLPTHHLPAGPGDTEYFQWSSEENSTLFWNSTITLYRILYKVIESLYGCNLGVRTPPPFVDIASSIIQIEQQLLNWQVTLPSPMKLVTQNDLLRDQDASLLRKFQVILTLRYHNLRILAHRPVLDRYLQHLDGSSLDSHEAATLWQIGHRSRSICLQSAETIINIVSTTTSAGSRRSGLGAWWFTLYYTFNAALTVVSILLSGCKGPFETDREHDTATIEHQMSLLDLAIGCMPLLDNNRMVEKCAKFTSALKYCVQGLSASRNHVEGATAGAIIPTGLDQDGVASAAHGIHFPPPVLDFLPPDFDLASMGLEGISQFMGPAFMDDFSAGDLFC